MKVSALRQLLNAVEDLHGDIEVKAEVSAVGATYRGG